jgi:hypothetical protein
MGSQLAFRCSIARMPEITLKRNSEGLAVYSTGLCLVNHPFARPSSVSTGDNAEAQWALAQPSSRGRLYTGRQTSALAE